MGLWIECLFPKVDLPHLLLPVSLAIVNFLGSFCFFKEDFFYFLGVKAIGELLYFLKRCLYSIKTEISKNDVQMLHDVQVQYSNDVQMLKTISIWGLVTVAP